ncbi:MAG: hypothetical protein PUI72_01585 [Prevotellaceae bacterium]|nr:hypothetical protein [Prevotellaceae bacterium]MDD7097223.1 hypothetical protein [Prevotellaceae bacterium]MDY5249399.1 hypothetical protein [Prevotella sp.]MDY6198843.1 hypothetical protein [Prevotella sp.]
MKKKTYIAPGMEIIVANISDHILAGSGDGVSGNGQQIGISGGIVENGNAGGAAAKGNSFSIWRDED